MKTPSFRVPLSALSKVGFCPLVLLFCWLQHSFSQVTIPTFKSFQPISAERSAPPPMSTPPPFQRPPGYNPLLPNDPYREQNLKIMRQGGMAIPGPAAPDQHKQIDEIYSTNQQDGEIAYLRHSSQVYQNKFREYLKLNPDSFSIAKAIYLTESAWFDQPLSWQAFETEIKKHANAVKQLLQREGFSAKSNRAINYGVQKLYKQHNSYYKQEDKKLYKIEKLEYDFNDPMGKEDWRNMFVSKLLATGKGQCHSMPEGYLCVVQELGGKAYLALAPGHSYIQYFDEEGRKYNFETTNGRFISENWMIRSTGVNAAALKHGTYLDTLSSRKLYAYCLGDMLQGYVRKVGYDAIANQMVEKILEMDDSNISALTIQKWYIGERLKEAASHEGNPPPDQLANYPVVYSVYKELMAVHARLDNIGAQTMPLEIYQQWLKSMNDDNQKEQDKQTLEKLLRELQKLKKVKPAFINTPKK